MQKQKIKLPELTLVGLTARTNNKSEMNPETAKIGKLISLYCDNKVADNFKLRTNPGVIYSVYTNFDSDEHGDYTYFVGEVVESTEGQDLTQFKTISIPESSYQKFTTESGSIPDIVISSWQKIWTMKESDFGGKRKYIADFEIFDQRALDPKNAVVDICVGVEF